LKEEKVESSFSFIVGIPGETPEEALATIQMVRRLNLKRESIQVGMGTRIYPGTHFCEIFEKEYGLIDWDSPDPSIAHLFNRDPLENMLFPTVGIPAGSGDELNAAKGLPFVNELRNHNHSSKIRDISGATDHIHSVELWSPFILPQLRYLDVLLKGKTDLESNVLCLKGKSKDQLLALYIADCCPGARERILPKDLMPQFPDSEGQDDGIWAMYQNEEFDILIDLNNLGDLSSKSRFLSSMK